ncbi:MAG: exonuclease SbcCD subunit D [Anaerolineae bacterium]|nr:exonuclease SbcCD subunit D [Anaerolineae bacterium]
MIRMIHFADIHIGMENYGRTHPDSGLSTRVHDFLRRMDEMIDYARDHEADLVIFAGDAFKNRQPNPTFQREFAWRVRDLAEMCPVVLLIGNHDLPTAVVRASSLEIYDTLAVPNVTVGDDYELHQIKTKHGPVQVATAPYPLRSRLLENEKTHGLTLAEVDLLLQQKLQVILRRMANEAAQSDAPRVLTGHFTVSGAVLGSERNVMVGRDVAVLLGELADPVWDYVALGHVHKHQNLTAGHKGVPPVVYSGSMERIDFGEEADDKGFCWVELERGSTHWQFVQVGARPFITLRIDTRKSADPMQKILDAINSRSLEDAVVRLVIQADVDNEAKIQDTAIYNALRDATVSTVAAMQKEIERPTRARLGGSPEGLTSTELLERYLQSKGVAADRIRELLERAEPFFSVDN